MGDLPPYHQNTLRRLTIPHLSAILDRSWRWLDKVEAPLLRDFVLGWMFWFFCLRALSTKEAHQNRSETNISVFVCVCCVHRRDDKRVERTNFEPLSTCFWNKYRSNLSRHNMMCPLEPLLLSLLFPSLLLLVSSPRLSS
jgi:hypothetical protein